MDSEKHDETRRLVVNGMATTFVMMMATPSQAQQAAADGGSPRADGTPPNPVTEYPKPPFPKQQQPWPGLCGKMDPKPDHGEASYKGSGRLKGRKALITGGDSGIGRAAAIAYGREGADVVINYLPAEEPDAREVIELIRKEGRKAHGIPGDIKDEAFCKRLVSEAVRELGGLDILVNNAARQIAHKSIDEITTANFDETFKTNVYAMFWITKAALEHMKAGSAIINTASINAYEPSEEIIDYAATKGAIMIFTKGLAKQLAQKGIRVNAVAPGPFWTALQVTGGQPPDKIPDFGKETPMGRPGQPVELAGIYVLLASGESSYSSGQVFAAVGARGGP
ncbi:MAG TPA: SDR family oxidoreductase [Usitatibacter sp.]|jgi:hypothetical protein|nr:SDR family oxidoreductase [Usitatibacter sp.]